MADNSKIEWSDASWQVTHGCTILTPGCAHCYAMRQAQRLALMGQPQYAGLTQQTKNGPVWNGTVRPCSDAQLMAPLRWRKPRMIFVNSMSDLFHEDVPDGHIDKMFAVMALAPQHTFQVLTKRSARMLAYLMKGADRANDARFDWAHAMRPGTVLHHTQHEIEAWLDPCATGARRSLYHAKLVDWPLPNVWLGVSVEDQQRASERIPDLLATPAAVRFISAEPLLGPVDVRRWLEPEEIAGVDLSRAPGSMVGGCANVTPALDWVIVGGESGPGARPMHPGWARSLRDQCQDTGVPFFFKQFGEWRELYNPGDDIEVDACTEYAASIVAAARNPGWIAPDGRFFSREADLPEDGTPCRLVERVGKKAAGALLDGREWREFPRR